VQDQLTAPDTVLSLALSSDPVPDPDRASLSLGTYYGSLPPLTAKNESAGGSQKWRRHNVQRKLTPGSAVSYCMAGPHEFGELGVARHAAGNRYYTGLRHCDLGSCIVCAERRVRKAFKRAERELTRWVDAGDGVLLVAFTMQHSDGESLQELMDVFKLAIREMEKGRPYRTMRESLGVGSRVKGTEVTIGQHGWHVHMHQALRLTIPQKHRSKDDRVLIALELERRLRQLFTGQLAALGRYATYEQAVKVTLAPGNDEDPEAAARYVTKGAMEAVSPMGKKGRRGNLTPWQLLDLIGDKKRTPEKRAWATAMFQEFEEATKGTQWTSFSRDCVTAEEAEDDQEDAAASVMEFPLTSWEWSCIRRAELQAWFLAMLERNGVEHARRELDELCNPAKWRYGHYEGKHPSYEKGG
jgi:hypothetical protein